MRQVPILAVAVSVGVFLFSAAVLAQNTNQPSDNALRRTGSSTRPSDALAPDARDIRGTLKDVSEAALSKKGFDNLIDNFVDADRNRLGKDGFVKKDHPTLDGRIDQLQKDWKARYNQDFKIKDSDTVFGDQFAMIIQSKVGDEARLAGERTVVTETGTTVTRDENKKMFGGDTNLEPGRKIATATIVSGHSLPGITVPMIHEMPDHWRIDVPDSYSAQQTHDNLLTQLTWLGEHKDEWPANVDDAYRLVSHRVLMAVLNIPMKGGGVQPMEEMNRMERGQEPRN